MIHNLTHDEYAIEYVKGVREANPQEYPTWEMLETAFVAGMTKAQELYGQPRPRRGHIPLTEGHAYSRHTEQKKAASCNAA